MVRQTIALLLLIAVACSSGDNPCPAGYRPSRTQGRCLPPEQGGPEPALDRADAEEPPPDPTDEQHDSSAVPDASLVPDARAHVLEPSGLELDASDIHSIDMDASARLDADATWQVALDATSSHVPTEQADADAASAPEFDADAPLCTPSDVAAWRAVHLTKDLRGALSGCSTQCEAGVDCMDECLRRKAGVEACQECTTAQTRCGLTWCSYACLPSRADDSSCLACLCQADCSGLFEGCAGRSLGLCEPLLFGSNMADSGVPLDGAVILFGKQTSGAQVSVRFDADAGGLAADVSLPHVPVGATRLIALTLAQREFVFRYGESCAAPPCTVRAYPISAEGKLGAPVFEERWEAGIQDVTSLSAQGQTYLLRLHSPSTPEHEGYVWIDRIEWLPDEGRLRATPALRASPLSQTRQRYTRVAPFAISGMTFLFMHSPLTGEARMLQVTSEAEGVSLVPSGAALFLSRGWDAIEAFKASGRWYLFGFKLGQTQADEEPAGHVRAWQPTLDGLGNANLGNPIFDEFRGVGTTHMASFTDAGGRARFAFYDSNSGQLSLHVLSEEPAQWRVDFRNVEHAQQRGKRPPWDVFGVVGQGKWP